jgi:hypothetical protein
MKAIATIALLLSATLFTPSAWTQTFHGTVSGFVEDGQGASIPGASVQLSNPATGQSASTKSNKEGQFIFPELTVGVYQLKVSSEGFQSKVIESINVEVTKVLNLKVELSVGSVSTVVDVAANAIQTDTTSSALVSVIDSKAVKDMPMNGRDFTQMLHFTPGASVLTTSVNGAQASSINFQIDGADNNDSWHGKVSSNQGGVGSVAGGLVPIEAIDQFSMQSGGEADQGHNAGANQNMVLKSGTNDIHGNVFYFDRNEFFAAISPVAPVGSRKPLIRNHQGGFTLGGPIWKNHTFLFLAGEFQVAKATTALTDSVLSDAWISDGTAFLGKFGLTPNQLSLNLYKLLYPSNSKSGPASTNNYFAQGISNFHSYNGVIKLDHHFSQKQSLSIRYLGETGTQTAPKSTSDYAQYFQTAPTHVHNFSVVHSYAFNSHLLNQLTLGVNYFLQRFNDADQNFYPQANAGLNLGISSPMIADGAPTITFTGTVFDGIAPTPPSGRTDIVGHATDSLQWIVGSHEFKIGAEYRHANTDQLYFTSARGTFIFDGTRGPWTGGTSTTDKANCASIPVPQVTSTGTCNTNILALADFLNGEPSNSSGAKLLEGNAERIWTLTTPAFWFGDNYKVTKKLDLNFGLRYTIPGVVTAAKNDVYSFVPGATPGFQLGLYHNYYGAIAPRFGFSFSPLDSNRTVIRGSWGIFYDFPAIQSWVTGTTTNGGANYPQNNPAGADAAAIFNASNVQWQPNVNPFVGAVAPQVGAFGVNQNFKMPYAEVLSFGIEQQLSKTTLFSLGYVGSEGRRLTVLLDANQPVANGTATASPRPYPQTSFPNENPAFAGNSLLGINEVTFEGSSNYSSLQATIKQALWHGVVATMNYTWGKAMDDSSSATTPMNSYNLSQDYGPSTYDNRHLLNGTVFYSVPQLFHAMPLLTKGFQLNAIYTYSSGIPISPAVSTDVSKTTELKDRPNVTPGVNPYTGLQLASSTATGRQYRTFTNATGAFTNPANGTYGNEQRDTYYGNNFRAIDFSLFKHTPITERVMSEFRVEIFNICNFNNFADPSVSSITSSTFGLVTQTRNGSGAPGLGYGEPFNIQFAAKISF